MSEKKKYHHSVARFHIGSKVLFQLILVILIVILANFLGCTEYKRIDLTHKKEYTLAETSLQFLQSQTLQSHPSGVKITAVIKTNNPHYLRIRALLEETRAQSKQRIELEFVDPHKNLDRTQQLADTFQHTFTQEALFIDARPHRDSPQSILSLIHI